MDIEKIKSKVTISSTGCWEWMKSCNSAGYGQLTENKVYWLAHRYSYACIHKLGKEDVVRHKCHNAKCCNPEHLEIGTHKDNWEDSRDLHIKTSAKRRKRWSIDGIEYSTIREASKQTGIHQGTLVKYTIDGIFDVEAYRLGCEKANVAPKV